ncbi:MAG: sensor histidine kinase KdpD, partial [Hyphomicrobiales bacterium]
MADQRRDLTIRPSPDALLEAARREERRAGRLKIFVGAAPGVGKTYEMLQQAHARLKEGCDVVVGVVETHGRQDTEALLTGLEIVPRLGVAYRGQQLDEMDIDAILARKPDIVLVDELAHTNASGSRHPKRYLDVEEILANGIDVYTTVNIQHIESLNDVIAQITRVQVRETLPDTVFNKADAVELIDITPEDLIQRLKDGKVYVPKQAERALENFFSPANLTALRELALRRTADRVDEQLLLEMKAGAISGPWAAGDRILVCINENKRSAGLIRYAKRLSDRMHAPFIALCIETRRTLQMSEQERDDVADALRLAESLGGDAVTVPSVGRAIADDIVEYAQANNVTQIVIERSAQSRWMDIFRGSFTDELVRKAGNISIHVIGGHDLDGDAPAHRTVIQTSQRPSIKPSHYAWGLVAVLAALGTGQIVQPILGLETVDLVFLLAVLAVAI